MIKYLRLITLFVVIVVSVCSNAKAQKLVHDFEFNGNLNDELPTGAVLSTVNIASSSYGTSPNSFTWSQSRNPGGGLALLTDQLKDPNAYSLGFRISFKETGPGYKKILSFKGTTVDNGLYFQNKNLEFFPFGKNAAVTYEPNTFYDFVLTRSSADTIKVYVAQPDGTVALVYDKLDASDASVPTLGLGGKHEFRFFMDDTGTNTEHSTGGTVRGIRVWDTPLTADEIAGALSSVTTGGINGITETSVNVLGEVNPQGTSASFSFDYGLTTSLGQNKVAVPTSGSGNTNISVSAFLTGLSPNTQYFYRLKSTNVSGDALGDIKTFTTVSNDFDGDGVPNARDLDDDNDGILDYLEGYGGVIPSSPSSTVNYTVSQTAANGPTIASPTSGYAISTNNSPGVFAFTATAPGESGSGGGTGTLSKVTINVDYAPNETVNNVQVGLASGAFDDGLFIEIDGTTIVNFKSSDYGTDPTIHTKFAGGFSWKPWTNQGNPQLELNLINRTVALMVDVTDGSTPARQNILTFMPFSTPNQVPLVDFEAGVTIGSAFQNNDGLGSISAQTLTFSADIRTHKVSASGNYDFQKLDSDEDGCFDVVEAGFSDPDGDGILGNSPVTVDADGKVTSGTDGYTTPMDGDANGILDFQEAGSNTLHIITQPVIPAVLAVGNDLSLSVTANSSNLLYQWQESRDGGASFNNLSDDAVYVGTNSNQLVVKNLNDNFNDYQYQVIVTESAFRCASSTTTPVTLKVELVSIAGVPGSNLWLKSDAGITNNGSDLTGWTDQTSINSFTVVGAPQYADDGLNFNPVVTFENKEVPTVLPGDYLQGNRQISFVDGFVVMKRDFLSGALIGGKNSGGTFGKAFFTGGSSPGPILYAGNGEQGAIVALYDDVIGSDYFITNIDLSLTIDPGAKGRSNGHESTIYPGAAGIFNQVDLIPMIGGTNNTGGASPVRGFKHFQGDVAEIILFPSGLSNGDKLKIESYLAIKYGISLDRSVANYVNASGASIWSNTAYWNDVFGIGKDDAIGLAQISSNSINTGSGDGTGQSGKGNIVLNNPSALSDGAYLIIGHNKGLLELGSADINGFLSLKRKWKVKKTGTVGVVDLSFNISDLPLLGASTTDFELIIDEDGDGDFKTGKIDRITPNSVVNNLLSFSGIDIPDGAVFTFGDQFPSSSQDLNANRIIVNPSFETGKGIPYGGDYAILESQIGNQPQIDGWFSTHPLYNIGGVNIEGPIEHWKSGFNSVPAQDKDYFVELNVVQPSRLYQHVYLLNGETVDWKYYHGKRTSNKEELSFSVYSDDGKTLIRQIDLHEATLLNGWQERVGTFTWNFPSGFYQIGFEATTPGNSGNFLDNVTIGLQAFTEFARDTVVITEGARLKPKIFINGQVKQASSFSVQVDGGTAVEGTDFLFVNKTTNVAVGNYGLADTLSIALETINDKIKKADRLINLSIQGVTGDIVARDANANGVFQQSFVVVIKDNDQCLSAGSNSTYSLCASDGSSLNLFAQLSTSPDAGGAWTDTSASGVNLSNPASVDVSALAVGNYQFTYAHAAAGLCPASSAVLTIEIRTPFPAGEDNSLDYCSDAGPLNLFTSLSGSPQSGGLWTESTSSGANLSDPTQVDFSAVAPGNYVFRYVLSSEIDCGGNTAYAQLTVNIEGPPNAGMVTAVNVCDGGPSTTLNFTTVLLGTPDGGGAWVETSTTSSNVILTTLTAVDFNGVPAGQYTFDYTVNGKNVCAAAVTKLTVNVNQNHNPGTSTSVGVCNDGSGTLNLETLIGTADRGGIWTLNGQPIIDPTLVSFTGVSSGTYIYTYTIAGVGVCNTVSSTVTVTVSQEANAGSPNTVNVCDVNPNASLNFVTSIGPADAGGTWTESTATSSGVSLANPANVNFNGVPAGRYTYVYTVNGPGACGNVANTLTVNVSQPHNAGTPSVALSCNAVGSTVDLFAQLQGNPDTGGVWTLAGTTVTAPASEDFSSRAPGNYVYTYTLSGAGTCQDVSNTLTVTVEEDNDAGGDSAFIICNNGGVVNLFDALTGTPDTGGLWLDLDKTGLKITNNLIDFTDFPGGTYNFEYFASNSATCSPATSNVKVTVDPYINVGPDITINACNEAGATYNLLQYGVRVRPTGPDFFWTNLSTIPLDLTDPTKVSFDGILLSSDTVEVKLIYGKNASSKVKCAVDDALITIKLYKKADAGLNATSSICDGGSSTILDLFDALNGTPEATGTWVETVQNPGDAMSGVNLSNPTAVNFSTVPGGKYFYQYTVPGRGACSDAISLLTVNVNQDADPGAAGTLIVCNEPNLTFDLFANLGGNADHGGQWLDQSGSGVDLTNPAAVDFSGLAVGDYVYRYTIIGQGVCNDVSSDLTVTVVEKANAGQDNTTSVCDGGPSTFVDLFGTLTGNPETGGVWSEISSSGVSLSNPNAVDFNLIPPGKYTFEYLVQGAAPCSNATSKIIVNVNQEGHSGVASPIISCADNVQISLFSGLKGAYDPGGTWLDVDGTGLDISNPNWVDVSGLGAGNYNFTYTLMGVGVCLDVSTTTTLTITQKLSAGQSTIIDVCNGTSTVVVDLFGQISGNPNAGGTWYDVDGLGVNFANPNQVDFAGVAPGSYELYYLVSQTGFCGTSSALLTINVMEAPVLTLPASLEVCNDNLSSLDFQTLIPSSPLGTWTDDSQSGVDLSVLSTVSFNGVLPGNYTFTYTIPATGACGEVKGSFVVIVEQAANAGVNSITGVSNDGSSINIFSSIQGNPEAGGIWNDVDNINVDLTDPTAVSFANVTAGTYRLSYSVIANSRCGVHSSVLTITVNQSSDAGSDGYLSVCDGGSSTIKNLFTSLNGAPQTGGLWVDLDGSGADISNPLAVDFAGVVAGKYRYRYTITGTGSFGNDTAIVTANVNQVVEAGSDAGLSVCNSDVSVDLFNAIAGTPEKGGTWSDQSNAGLDLTNPSQVDFSGLSEGTYLFIYALGGDGNCLSDSSTLTVTVSNKINAGIDASLAACNQIGAADLNLFAALGQGVDAGGTWADVNSSGVNLTNPAAVDFDGLAVGIYQYSYTVTVTGTCAATASATVSVNVVAAHVAGVGSSITVPNNGTSVDLNSLLTNADPGGVWTDLNNSGVNLTNPSAVSFANLAAGAYQYQYAFAANGPCIAASAIVTVNVIDAASSGINTYVALCTQDASSLNLFQLMQGNLSTSGTWISLNNGIKIDDPGNIDLSNQRPGTYLFNYIVQNTGSIDKKSLTIELAKQGNAGIGNSLNNEIVTCNRGSSPLDFFSMLTNSPDLNGTWSEITNSGADLSNPSSVTFEGAPAGFYEFQYEVGANVSCASSYARLFIEVDDGSNPGNSTILDVCNGANAEINLFTSLGGTPDEGGEWTDQNGASVNVIIDLTGFPAGSYVFNYTIQPRGFCAELVSSSVTINLQRQPNAGFDNSIDVTFNDNPTINFLDGLLGVPDLGGTWIDVNNTGIDLSDPTMVNLSVLEDGVYTFSYIIDGGAVCNTVESDLVIMLNLKAKSDEDTKVMGGFSPNGDGINDQWQIVNIHEFPNNKVLIFNRWGHKVYEIQGYNNADKAFDGVANNGSVIGKDLLPAGTYYYIIDYGDGKESVKGFLTLVR